MENDPLQQLRDVHLPPEPSWWPPAVGWWLVAALLLVLLLWTTWRLVQAHRRRAPIRSARVLLNALYQQFASGQIDAAAYLHEGNELIKRLLVRAYGRHYYAPLAGQAWLEALDKISGTRRFTDGPGRVLGEARFSAQPQVDVPALHELLLKLLSEVKP